jgi:peptide deformylase
MATRYIIQEGDELLRKHSREVEKIDKRTLTLLDDMKETLAEANGVGLAAVQVGVLKRVVVIDTGEKMLELINPVITKADGEQQDIEGCLSLPGKWGITDRPAVVTVSVTDRNGKKYEYTGEGLLARALCHELDHLEGRLFIDKVIRMVDPKELGEK